MLLKNARASAKTNPLNLNADTTLVLNNSTNVNDASSLMDLCRQLSYSLLCTEQSNRLQGHAYRRRVDVLEGRSETEITRRCYGLLFDVDKLRIENQRLRNAQRTIIKKCDRNARKKYRNQIATLESKLMKSNALFGQYKESMRSDMLSEISTAKKAALLKIIDSGTVTQELRQRAIKIAAVEDEISDLKRDNGRLRQQISQEKLERDIENTSLLCLHSEKMEMLEDELKEKSKAWKKQTEMERRDVKRQKELNQAQTSASRLVHVVTEMTTRLEASEKSKKKLQQWKIRNQHTMVMLEKQMSTLQRGLNGTQIQTEEEKQLLLDQARNENDNDNSESDEDDNTHSNIRGKCCTQKVKRTSELYYASCNSW